MEKRNSLQLTFLIMQKVFSKDYSYHVLLNKPIKFRHAHWFSLQLHLS